MMHYRVVDGGMIEMVERAALYADHPAIITPEGAVAYSDLVEYSARVASVLLDGRPDLDGARVAFLSVAGYQYVVAQWGIWRAGGIAVPLATSHPRPELERLIRDCTPERILCDATLADRAREVGDRCGIPVTSIDDALTAAAGRHPIVSDGRPAMIIYTSGTTGKPKGVVTTHANINAQIGSLVEAWEWREDDRTLLVLPLHHVHGVINVVGCALWSGATIDVAVPFDAERTWARLSEGAVTVFMAVPTVYRRLIDAWDAMGRTDQQRAATACYGMRLFVSGSAALPVRVLDRWRVMTGHTLLERYGTSETGMVLSNPLHGERRAGTVGRELPGVEVRLGDREDSGGGDMGDEIARREGEILVLGEGVFSEYWNRPEETAAAFDGDWYRTGDVAVLENDSYRIIGRRSIDIIKTGGYKVSALEIEEVLRDHPAIGDCAVVGMPDEEWGELVCAAIEGAGDVVGEDEIRSWAKARLAPYKVPRAVVHLDALPRNAMGKVVKSDLRKLFAGHA